MTGTAIAIASAFAFLSPKDPGPYTPLPAADRAALEAAFAAGRQPLVFSDDAVFTMTNQADVVAAAVFRVLPRKNLLHTWRGLGVKVLSDAAFDAEGSAEHFRRSCAFLPLRDGADGVWVRNPEALPPAWRAALDEARKDAAAVDYLRVLARQAVEHENPELHIEGRRAAWWLGYMPADWEDLDCLRLECVAYAKRLEQLLGLPERDLPTDFAAAPDPGTQPFRPFGERQERPAQIRLTGLASKAVPLDDDGLFTFSSDLKGFSFTFACREPTPVATTYPGGTFPVGQGTFTLSLYLPARGGAGYSPYHFEIDPWAFWVGPRAATPGRGSFLYSLEERFTPYTTGYERPQVRVHCRPQLRTFSKGHPDPHPRLSVATGKDGGWSATISFSWLSFYGQWPAQRNGEADTWYVAIDRLPDGSRPAPKALLWPRGSEANFAKIAGAIDLNELTRRYKEQLDRTESVWKTAYGERLYGFAKTPRPTYHRFDLESDEAFRIRFVAPLLDANRNAWELFRSDKEHTHPGFPSAPEKVRMQILKSLDRLLYLSQAVGESRRDYLRDRFAGKPLGDPPKPKESLKLSETPVDGEFIRGGEFQGMELDDVEF